MSRGRGSRRCPAELALIGKGQEDGAWARAINGRPDSIPFHHLPLRRCPLPLTPPHARTVQPVHPTRQPQSQGSGGTKPTLLVGDRGESSPVNGKYPCEIGIAFATTTCLGVLLGYTPTQRPGAPHKN